MNGIQNIVLRSLEETTPANRDKELVFTLDNSPLERRDFSAEATKEPDVT
ncbi:MAG: hypothetical protein PHP25_04850 [Candidatus Moranbacteria bacterium]|nr:hypothetical protein [Candidatus Moranbacteria bacterium]